jgi:hypothetical protein
VIENKALRSVFGPKREEVTGEWRKLHNEELHNLNFSLNIIRVNILRMMRCRACRAHGRDEKCIQHSSAKT